MMWFRRLVALALLGLAAVSGLAWWDRYWRWRGCFNDQGRCWDRATQQVYLEQAGEVWGGFTLLFIGLAALVLLRRK